MQSSWQLQFAGRQNDEIHYTFAATNRIDLNADAHLSGQYDSSTGTISAQLNRSTTTHNPTISGDDGFGQQTFMALAGQGVNTPSPTNPGELVLMKRDGKDVYYMTFGMTQALPSYTYHSVYNYDCYGTYNTYTDDYDNVSFTHREHEQGDKSCFRIGGDNAYKTSGPLVFVANP